MIRIRAPVISESEIKALGRTGSLADQRLNPFELPVVMADFSHLAATMDRMRRPSHTAETKAAPNVLPGDLKNAPYYVGTLSQDAVEMAMVDNGKGDFVVRQSERIPNSLVLMVKLTNVTGMQRRIMFHGGLYVMELNGETRSHANLNALLKMEPAVLRPVAKSVLAFHKNSQGGQMRSRSSSASGQVESPSVCAGVCVFVCAVLCVCIPKGCLHWGLCVCEQKTVRMWSSVVNMYTVVLPAAHKFALRLHVLGSVRPFSWEYSRGMVCARPAVAQNVFSQCIKYTWPVRQSDR
eukprot:m.430722 g.430722  ORF g.430722 m.430722 type:complete len:294 (+) comp21399_c0_seq8:428-1309(+)